MHPIILGSIAASLVMAIVFVVWEQKFAYEPVFPPRLLIQRDIITPYAIVALQLGAQYAVRLPSPLLHSQFTIMLIPETLADRLLHSPLRT